MPSYNLKIALTSTAIILSTFSITAGWLDTLPRYIVIFLSLAALVKLYSEDKPSGRKVIGIFMAAALIFFTGKMLITSKVIVGSYRFGSHVEDAPFWFVLMYSGLWLWVGYAFVKEAFTTIYAYESKEHKTYPAMINIDFIDSNDETRINSIRNRDDKLYAYSRKGALAAKNRAKLLGLEDSFSLFLDKKEVDKAEPWNLN